jgi:hypothetical protein
MMFALAHSDFDVSSWINIKMLKNDASLSVSSEV